MSRLAITVNAAVLAIVLALAALVVSTNQGTIADLQLKNQSVTGQLGQAQGRLKDLQAANQKLSDQVATSDQKLADAQASLRNTNAQLTDSTAKLAEIQTVNQTLNGQLTDAQKKLGDAQASNKALNQKIAGASQRAEILDGLMNLGLASEHGKTISVSDSLAVLQKIQALNDPDVSQLVTTVAQDSQNAAATEELILRLLKGMEDALR